MIRDHRLWSVGLDAVLFAPLLVALVLTVLTGGDGWLVNVSVAVGLIATSLLVVVVVMVSRVQGITRTVGLARVTGLHRRLSVLLLGLVVAHIVAAVAADSRGLGLLDVTRTTSASRAAILGSAGLLLAALVVPRVGRSRYALRARLHAVVAVIGLAGVALHILLLRRLVTNPVMAAVLALLAAVVAVTLVRRWVTRPLLGHGAHVVSDVKRETPSTSTITLQPVDRRRPLSFEPGQFVWLRLDRDLPFAAEHPFTLSGSTTDGGVQLTVRGEGAFVASIRQLEPGRTVWLDGPHGDFVPTITPEGSAADPDAAPDTDLPARELPHARVPVSTQEQVADGLVLIAGGVGVTPMISMLRALADARDLRPHALLVVERSGEALFSEELADLQERLRLTVRRVQDPTVDVGLVTPVLPVGARARYDYFLSGPPGLVDAAVDVLRDCGVPDERMVIERFG